MDKDAILHKISLLESTEGRIAYLNEILQRQGALQEETVSSAYEALQELYKTTGDMVNAVLAKAAIADPNARSNYRQRFAPEWPYRDHDPRRRRFSREISEALEPSKRDEARKDAEKEEKEGDYDEAATSWKRAEEWEKAAINYGKAGGEDFQAAVCMEKAGKRVDWERVASACIQGAALNYDSNADEANRQLWEAVVAYRLAGIGEDDARVQDVYRLFQLDSVDDAWYWAEISYRSGSMSKRDAFLAAARKYEAELAHEVSGTLPKNADALEKLLVAAARAEHLDERSRRIVYNIADCYREAGEFETAAQWLEPADFGREAMKMRRLLVRQKNR
ncbi:MAG: hypothetical protein HYX24_00445 [Candidatus Aenigmarchaeota archaeon]|nr:hypothetical protein [Candidatus Aenigmarchaeota archaeon]